MVYSAYCFRALALALLTSSKLSKRSYTNTPTIHVFVATSISRIFIATAIAACTGSVQVMYTLHPITRGVNALLGTVSLVVFMIAYQRSKAEMAK